jgi:hypothetical protein
VLLAQSSCILIGYEGHGTSERDGSNGSDGGGIFEAGQRFDSAVGADDGGSPGDAALEPPDGALSADSGTSPAPELDGGIELAPDGSFDRDAAVTETCPPEEDCAPTCTTGEGECVLDCSEAETCEASCAQKTRCEVECLGTNNCELTCAEGAHCGLDCGPGANGRTNNCTAACEPGARCGVHCAGVNNCEVVCEDKSQCAIDCTGAEDCDSVECVKGAKCLLYCPGGNCEWASCDGGASTCPDGTITCNVGCPPPRDWTWEDFSTYWGSPP